MLQKLFTQNSSHIIWSHQLNFWQFHSLSEWVNTDQTLLLVCGFAKYMRMELELLGGIYCLTYIWRQLYANSAYCDVTLGFFHQTAYRSSRCLTAKIRFLFMLWELIHATEAKIATQKDEKNDICILWPL